MDKINWKGTKVLVTGADGFIGSHIAKALIDKGAKVTTIVRDALSPDTCDQIYNITVNRQQIWNGSTWRDLNT